MSQTTDFVAELIHAANTIDVVTPFERRRLIERSIAVIAAQRHLLELHNRAAPPQPDFMQDMERLAQIGGCENGIDVLISAGMLMLAGEIQMLRRHCKEIDE